MDEAFFVDFNYFSLVICNFNFIHSEKYHFHQLAEKLTKIDNTEKLKQAALSLINDRFHQHELHFLADGSVNLNKDNAN